MTAHITNQLQFVKSNAIQSMLENITVRSDRAVRVNDLTQLDWIASRSPFIVGTPGDVAEYLIQWVEDTDVDGFNLNRLLAPSSLKAFVDLVVPELQSRGAFKMAYAPGTLREKLFGRGAYLPCTHPAAAVRHASSLEG